MNKYSSPAIIERPLRYIRNRTAIRNDKGEITGYEPIYYLAQEISKNGNDPRRITLQDLARSLNRD